MNNEELTDSIVGTLAGLGSLAFLAFTMILCFPHHENLSKYPFEEIELVGHDTYTDAFMGLVPVQFGTTIFRMPDGSPLIRQGHWGHVGEKYKVYKVPNERGGWHYETEDWKVVEHK